MTTNGRREESLRGIPCRICGSTTSAAVSLYGNGVVCVANGNGRNRCREREIANMIREGMTEGVTVRG